MNGREGPTEVGPEVHAAGGVVIRAGPAGPEVLVVHRPRYDDWSFPKGKRDPGEDDLVTAVREVAEETGVRVEVGAELPTLRYRDHRGRSKQVRYWYMTVREDPGFRPNEEVDALRWIPLARAATLLTYAHDRDLVAAVRDVWEAGG